VNVLGEVKLEMTKSEMSGDKNTVSLDVVEMISKACDFIENIKKMAADGNKMAINVDGFVFSFGKGKGEYDLDLKVNLTVKPKTSN